tara:strand:- start:132 stop:890 length:759 start_codon:yes stop_codon:yes gene_type:complete
MIFNNFFLIIFFLFFVNCSTVNNSLNKKKLILNDGFSNKGFAMVYDQKYFDEGIISKKIDERSLIIFQKNLKNNTQVKVTNLLNNKSLIARVGKNSSYPLFNNSVLSKRIANELDLDPNEPYIEILEIIENSIFIAKKAKTYEEEKNVAKKAPVKTISINDLNNINIDNKKSIKKIFSYEIKVADFFFNDNAKVMLNRIINETEIKNVRIKEITKQKYRVFLGPFNNINSLQKSYNDISILEFENFEIIKND